MSTHCAIALLLLQGDAGGGARPEDAELGARQAESLAELRIFARWTTGEPVRGAEVRARVRELERSATEHPNDVPVSDSNGRMTLFVPAGYRYRVAARSLHRFGTHPITDVEIGHPGVHELELEFTEILNPTLTQHSLSSFGAALAGVGDTNGDGAPDLFIGATEETLACKGAWSIDPQRGSAWLVTAATGELLFGLRGDCPGDRFATSMVAIWDWNGDGVRDCAIGAPGHDSSAGYVRIVSSTDGGTLATLQSNALGDGFGTSMTCDPQARLLAVGAPDGSPGAVYVFGDGAEVPNKTLLAPANEREFGAAIALVDFDGDDELDYLVGAPGTADSGSVAVLSGADGRPLATLYGTEPGQRFGAAVAALPDIDQDGAEDFAIAAPTDRRGHIRSSGTARSSVLTYSPRTLQRIFEYPSAEKRRSNRFGFALGPCADVDEDGVAELLVGAPDGQNGMSGEGWAAWLCLKPGRGIVTASNSYTQETYKSSFSGSSFAPVGDINGDGIEEVAIGAPGFLYPGLVYFASYDGTSHPVAPITPGASWRALGAGPDDLGAMWFAGDR